MDLKILELEFKVKPENVRGSEVTDSGVTSLSTTHR